MKYRIGLDIGIASVGWSAVMTDDNGEPLRILDLGSRIFDKAENPQDGSPLALPRRQARGLRRLVRRRAHRIERVKALLENEFGADVVNELDKNQSIDIFKSRVDGLSAKLDKISLGKICIYFVKHRGFKSSRKAGKADKDEGVLLTATQNNHSLLLEKGYKTIGEMLYKDEKFTSVKDGQKIYKVRNKGGSYDHTFLRSDLLEEIEQILSKQVEFGVISSNFVDKYKNIFTSQRSFDEGPGKGGPKDNKYSGTFAVGKCSFETNENRAPKSSYTVEYTIALEKLNNLRLVKRGESEELTSEQREKVISEIKKKKEIKYEQLRKLLKIDEGLRFNLLSYSKKGDKDPESAVFVSMKRSYEIRSCLTEENAQNIDLLDEIANVISITKSLDNQKRIFEEKFPTLTLAEIEKIGKIDAVKFSNLSLVARKKILPYLEQGFKYSEACEKAGYNHSQRQTEKQKYLKGDEITDLINGITSPVVRRSFSQTLKVLNALILKYGSPIGINVEVAREVSKTYEERGKIEKANKQRREDNEKIKKYIEEEFKVSPKPLDIVKMRLYNEQNAKCAYSGHHLDPSRLFEGNYVQVDHVVPYSRCFDDSYNNKVLVLCSENQNKGNKIPYEYFGNNEAKWNEYCALVETFNCSFRKKQNLMRKKFDDDDASEWKERNLADTQYVSRLVYNTIKDYLILEPCNDQKQRHVYAVNGHITSYLRNMWGVKKIREDGDKHHALDATIIAVTTQGAINKITKYNQGKERFFAHKENYVDKDGVVMSDEDYDLQYGIRLPQPYEGFVDELKIRLSNEATEQDGYGNLHKGISLEYLNQLRAMGYTDEEIETVKPIFVSRVPKRKATGALHKDTRYSAKYNTPEKGNIIVIKRPLTKLKLDKNNEIEGYFNKESDLLLYNALKEKLIEFGGDATKAFANGFHKPKSDGTQGPEVKSVKLSEKGSVGFTIEKNKSYLKNDAQVRVDIFQKNGAYYCVPVYVKDVACGTLPNKAIKQGGYEKWVEMDESYSFCFSLYPNDLFRIKMDKPFKLESANKEEKTELLAVDVLGYYKTVDIDGGRIKFLNHDNSYEGRISPAKAKIFEKYQVDVLGNITKVKHEKRDTLKTK